MAFSFFKDKKISSILKYSKEKKIRIREERIIQYRMCK